MEIDIVYIVGALFILYFFIKLILYIAQGIIILIKLCIKTNFIQKYGRWAIVTGCTDGIGLAYTKELAKRGMNIVLISRNPVKLEAISNEITENYKVETKIITVDFTDGPEIYRKISGDIHGLDIGILVNNVGVIVDHPMYMEEMTENQIWDHINCNISSMTVMTSLVLPLMKEKRKGAIINLSSLTGLAPVPLMSVYSACKAYVMFLSRCLMFECRNDGITIQCLTPGYINTKMVAYSDHLKKGSIFVPSAQTYVKHALSTLGVIQTTSGYFLHESQAFIASHYNQTWWSYISGYINTFFRKSFIENQVKIKNNP